MNEITMLTNADPLIRMALAEDITSEDISTNAVMREAKQGEVDLICKEDGIIAGLSVFKRVFTLLDADTEITFFCQDGDEVKQGQKMGVVRGDIRVLLSGERTALNYLQRMSGSVAKAIEMAKEYCPFVRKIEIEVENLDMVKEAADAGADIIMLDNMSHDDMKEAIRIIDGRAETECSGNVTRENIAKLIDLGVDYISSGALTHSAPIMDISLKNLHATE